MADLLINVALFVSLVIVFLSLLIDKTKVSRYTISGFSFVAAVTYGYIAIMEGGWLYPACSMLWLMNAAIYFCLRASLPNKPTENQ